MKIKLPALRNLLIVPLAMILFLTPGCLGIRHDISNDPKYKTDYAINQIYQIQKPLFVEKEVSTDAFMSDSLWLENPGFSSDIPKTVEEYRLGNKEEWPKVLGLIEPKTKVRIIKLERQTNFDMGAEFFVEVKILDGTFANQVVDLASISNRADHWVPIVNPEYLELQK